MKAFILAIVRSIEPSFNIVLVKPADGHRNSTGGHHVETGAGLILGKPIFLIGSVENLFHSHENVREFDSVQAAIQAVLCFKPEDFKVSPHSADSYQQWTRTTALYPGNGEKKTFGVAYLAVGLGGEAGEVVDKILAHLVTEETNLLTAGGAETCERMEELTNLGEVIRKLQAFSYVAKQLEVLKRPMREGKMRLPTLSLLSESTLAEIRKELGDVAWYLARMADELGVSFYEVLAANVEKLMSRRQRGVLHGVGDNR